MRKVRPCSFDVCFRYLVVYKAILTKAEVTYKKKLYRNKIQYALDYPGLCQEGRARLIRTIRFKIHMRLFFMESNKYVKF